MEVFLDRAVLPAPPQDRFVLILEQEGFDQTGAQCTPAVWKKERCRLGRLLRFILPSELFG